MRHLRDGGHVAMLIDQKQNDGIAVPFFGSDAITVPAVARAPLRLPFGARRRGTLRGSPVPHHREAGNQVDEKAPSILTTMTEVNAVIEAWARARPEQWLWIHRRWPDEISSRKALRRNQPLPAQRLRGNRRERPDEGPEARSSLCRNVTRPLVRS